MTRVLLRSRRCDVSERRRLATWRIRLIRYVDLTPLLPDGEHLLNGLTIDDRGDAYATDSFSPAIYKIDAGGSASIFLADEEFRGPGVNLNGVVYHPGGFLLVVKKSTGALYRIPLKNPGGYTRVAIRDRFEGGDGLTLIGDDDLILVANKTAARVSNAAYRLRSDDAWGTAKVLETLSVGDVYPTTCTTLDGRLYLLSSHLDEWLGATDATRGAVEARGRRAQVRQLAEMN